MNPTHKKIAEAINEIRSYIIRKTIYPQKRCLKYSKDYFFTLSPTLITAISKVLKLADENNLLEGSAYYEFGLFKGFSLWYAQQESQLYTKSMEFYGFDSFEGLPKSKIDIIKSYWYEGAYKVTKEKVIEFLKTNQADMEKIKLFKGFYSEKLFNSITKHQLKTPSIIVIDSDVYESAVEVLKFVRTLIEDKSCYVLFDDFNAFSSSNEHGERKALIEFQKANKSFVFKEVFSFGSFGQCFIVSKAASK